MKMRKLLWLQIIALFHLLRRNKVDSIKCLFYRPGIAVLSEKLEEWPMMTIIGSRINWMELLISLRNKCMR